MIKNYKNKKSCIKQILMIAFLLAGIPANAVIRYVTSTGNGLQDGSSWENASNNPQETINISESGDSVWIAMGTYTPTHSADGWTDNFPTDINNDLKDQNNSFVLKSGVKIYGGFAGDETEMNQRNWIVNRTILSGDFNADDSGNNASDPRSAENAFHVVVSVNNTKGTVLDGFTIWGGNYYYEAYQNPSILVNGEDVFNNNGGGIYALKTGVTLNNLEIRRNGAPGAGGGLYCIQSDSLRGNNLLFFKNFASQGGGLYVNDSPKFKNLIINGNEAGVGSGISNTSSSDVSGINRTAPHYINTFIHANLTSPANGYGAVQNENADPVFTNCTIAGNYGGNYAGIFNYYNCWPTLNNTIVWNNMNTDPYGYYMTSYATVTDFNNSETTYNYCVVQNMDLLVSDGLDATEEGFDPLFIYLPTYYYLGNNGGSFTLQDDSPCINAGNSELYEMACGEDFEGWENEFALTPPPYDNSPYDYFGSWTPADKHSGKQASRLTGSNINIGSFEGKEDELILKIETTRLSETNNLMVFPNPVTSGATATIKLQSIYSEETQNEFIDIYTITGIFTGQIRVLSGTDIIETTIPFPAGSYILKWKNYETKLVVK